ncbi:hypothetical protein Rvan_2042 [Rhodomicrobium vannielii ATCC 17100]|uniref:Toprim domain-containing protein n=1 Tax=Rhodomicrobium vannielii (strain ATCC 17100 / DSM 162 / LMG 4299 / NCIMB 10020 / ATH 3.1.1) TaxID=648757 RepID=E3I1H9_RHOVT|nr:toprim domain-containing protein [Rhodomicrobium vannielii]ADP71270.1 hypothetical protein Rvan_2042 [Rhodomicrobium vannielii ATCC 17100]
MNEADIKEAFLAAMRASGVHMDCASARGGHPIADGKLKRADSTGKGRRRKYDIWYILHADERPVGEFGDYKHDIRDRWIAGKDLKQLSDAEKAAYQQRIAEIRRERETYQAMLSANAAKAAALLLSGSCSAGFKVAAGHPYLAKKKLPAFPGARVLTKDVRYVIDPEIGEQTVSAGTLIVPMFHTTEGNATLVSVQRIFANGDKRFLKGTPKKGAFHPVGLHTAPDAPIYIAEGYATAARIHEATGERAVAAFDAGNMTPVAIALKAKYPEARFIIMADNDRFTKGNPGVRHAREAADAIGAPLVIPQFEQGEDDATDFDDLHQKRGAGCVRAAIDAVLNPPVEDAQQSETDDMPFDGDNLSMSFGEERKPKPLVQVRRGAIHEAVDAANQVLADPAIGIFSRSGRLVRAVVYEGAQRTLTSRPRGEGNLDRPDGAIVVRELGEAALCETLTRYANFEKYDGRAKDWVSIDCPTEIARMLLGRQGYGWAAPNLRAVVRAPTLRPDFSVLSEPGYDVASGLLFLSDRIWHHVDSNPTRKDAAAALDVLLEPIEHLPFVDDVDRSAALALLLTAVIRPMLRNAPMFAVTAPAAGTGKSVTVDVASVLSTGKVASVITPTRDDIEMEKRLGAAAIEGDAVIAIDNISHPLASDQLCQLLTQGEVQVRILGRSENVKVPSTALICATGNNLTIVGDLVRRTIRIRLDAKREAPDERLFPFNPIDRALERRAEMVAAALTVLRAYHMAGMPNRAPPMGSFEDWSDIVRSALIWTNMPDPRGNVEEMRAEDPEKVTLREIMDALPSTPFTVKEVKRLVHTDDDLRTALAGYLDRNGSLNTVRFAGFLRRHRDSVAFGRAIRLAHSDERHGSVWSITQIDPCEGGFGG